MMQVLSRPQLLLPPAVALMVAFGAAGLGGCSDGIVSGGPDQEEADLGMPGPPEDPEPPSPPASDAGAGPGADQKVTPGPSPTCPSEAPRDPAYWPFEASDPWNTPLGSGATYATETSPGFDPKAGASLNCTGWSHPVYVARSTDPVRTFYREDGSVCAEIHVPDAAEPDGEQDAHLHVIDEKHSRVVETWGCWRDEDGDFHAGACVVNQLRGPGVFSTWHGVRAYGGSAIAGLIRKGELKSEIRHALAVAVASHAFNKNAPGGKPYVWPASSADNGWQSSYGSSGNLYMGSLLAIPPSVDLSKLGLSPAGLRLGKALQDYGAYLTDSTGGNLAFYAEPAAAAEVGGLAADLGKLAALLKVVTNNTPSSRGGGGTPRRCPAPPFLP